MAAQTHLSIHPHTPLPPRLPHDAEWSSLWRTLLVIHAKSSRVYISDLENELMVAGARMGEETVRESGIDTDTQKICYFN